MTRCGSDDTITVGTVWTLWVHSLTREPDRTTVIESETVTYTLFDDQGVGINGTLAWDANYQPPDNSGVTGAYVSTTEDTSTLVKGTRYYLTFLTDGQIIPSANGESSIPVDAV